MWPLPDHSADLAVCSEMTAKVASWPNEAARMGCRRYHQLGVRLQLRVRPAVQQLPAVRRASEPGASVRRAQRRQRASTRLGHRYAGMCLDNHSWGTANGTIADLYTCTPQANQREHSTHPATLSASTAGCASMTPAIRRFRHRADPLGLRHYANEQYSLP